MCQPVQRSRRPQPGLGRAVLQLRQKRQTTQKELADKADLSGRMLSAIETGSANPSWATVGDLAEALGVTVAEVAKLAEKLAR